MGHSVPLACIACLGHVTNAYTLAKEKEGERERGRGKGGGRDGEGESLCKYLFKRWEIGEGCMMDTCSCTGHRCSKKVQLMNTEESKSTEEQEMFYESLLGVRERDSDACKKNLPLSCYIVCSTDDERTWNK